MLGLALGMTSTNASARGNRPAAACSSSKKTREIRARIAYRSAAFHCRHCLQVSCSGYRLHHSVLHVARTKHHSHRTSTARIRPVVSSGMKIVEPTNNVASFEYFRAMDSDNSPGADSAVIVVRARTYSVEQNIASNVAIADQTDGASKLMLMSAAAPPLGSITGWDASPRRSENLAILKD